MLDLQVDADKHNFGQLVKPMERASLIYFQKPRPVYWEKLFFGNNSPLKAVFDTKGDNYDANIADLIFNLEIELVSEWSGFSKEVKSFNGNSTDKHFYSFGILLAYSFLFGIRDLHKFNVIKTESNLQVIDAEVVLTDLILPNESVLLPFKDVPFEVCGLSLLIDSLLDLTENQMHLIYAGYFDLFAVAYQKQQMLFNLLEGSVNSYPIRVILRNTKIYTNHLNGNAPILDLLHEETTQLNRGDIPYFFKRLQDEKVYWLSSDQGDISTVVSFDLFKVDIDRHAQAPCRLIGLNPNIERKMAQGALFLQRKLNDTHLRHFKWNEEIIKFNIGELNNTATGNVFKVSK